MTEEAKDHMKYRLSSDIIKLVCPKKFVCLMIASRMKVTSNQTSVSFCYSVQNDHKKKPNFTPAFMCVRRARLCVCVCVQVYIKKFCR